MQIDIPDSTRSINIHQNPNTGQWYATAWDKKDQCYHAQGASMFEALFHLNEDFRHGRSIYSKNQAARALAEVRDTSAAPISTDIEGIELDI